MTSENRPGGPGRPLAASREHVEQVALTLMLRDGYDAVSVDAIATAAGIGRTTFFRYFGSKPGVIWSPFDATITWLAAAIDRRADEDTMRAIRAAVVESTRSAVYSSDVWLERFLLLDAHPSLRADAYTHWERWKRVIAVRVADSEDCDPDDAVPMAVSGACQGVFLAALRNWRNSDEDREALLGRLDRSLAATCTALRPLLRAI